MLAPGSAPVFDSGLVLACLVSLVWFVFVGWRLTHRPVVAWRGPWLAAAGITAFSASLVGLYPTALGVNRSYEPVVKAVARNLEAKGMQPGDVVCGTGMNHGLQAVFKHYADLAVLVRARPDECRFALDRSRSGALLPDSFRRHHPDAAFAVIPHR